MSAEFYNSDPGQIARVLAIYCPNCDSQAVGTVERAYDGGEGEAWLLGYDHTTGALAHSGDSSLTFDDGVYDSETLRDRRGRPLLRCGECGHEWPWVAPC